MKKIYVLISMVVAGMLLAGCTFFGGDAETSIGVVPVETIATATGDAKKECLERGFQRDDRSEACERQNLKSICLEAANQWDEQTERCEFSEQNCLAAGNQRNEELKVCEYGKEQCLAMDAQRDEQRAACEIKTQTVQQMMDECLNDGAQWDHMTQTCQTN